MALQYICNTCFHVWYPRGGLPRQCADGMCRSRDIEMLLPKTTTLSSSKKQSFWGRALKILFWLCISLFLFIFLITRFNSSEPKYISTSATTKDNQTNMNAPSMIESAVQKIDNRQNKVKKLSSQEIEEMEAMAQYSGSDPIVRKRLGLPPKEELVYDELK
jgi:hypothetical protein